MNMRQRIAWKHVVNQKGNIYLMDEAEKTYIVDFSKLSPIAAKRLHQAQLFQMIGIYALPISLMLITMPYDPSTLVKISIFVGSILFILFCEYLVLLNWVIPQNIREILEEKKRK